MKFSSLKPTLPRLQRSAVALALAAFGVGASALPVFTVDGDGTATAAQGVRADNILISDFARVFINSTNPSNVTFTESGYLTVTDFQLGGTTVMNSGVGSAYNMYVEFIGAGTLSSGTANPLTAPTFGQFTSLDYRLYSYGGPAATFGVDTAGAKLNGVLPNFTTTGVVGEVELARGSLIDGTVSTSRGLGTEGKFSPTASTLLTFNLTAAGQSVFTDPRPFYNAAFAAFTNNPSQVTLFDGGFGISQGGGSINFAAPIPEPETYALMLAGLAAVGFVARRRRPQA